MQRHERVWERLLTLLGTLGDVDASTPGRVRLRVEGHHVELLMTESEWGDLVGTINGSFVPPAAQLLQALSRAQAEEARYVVFDTYELHVSHTPELAHVAEREAEHRRVQEYLASHPDAQVAWRAFRPGEERS